MSKRILIVEDEGILRVGTTLQLMSLGFEVIGHFQSGEEAIKNITDLNPDLILMDIKLAGEINGIETVRQIQKKIDVPVVYLSAYSNHELIEKAETTKPFRYLIKPLDEMELKFTIDKAIESYEKEKVQKIKNEVLNNLSGMLYRFSIEDRKVTFFNDHFENLMGLKEDELKTSEGHFLGPLIVQKDYESVQKTLKDSLNLKLPFTLNYRIKDKGNKIYHFQEMAKPVVGDNDDIRYIDGIIFDLKTFD